MDSPPAGLHPGFLIIGAIFCLMFLAAAFLAFKAVRHYPRRGGSLRAASLVALVVAGGTGALCLLEIIFRIIYPGGFLTFQPYRISRSDARVEQLDSGYAFWEYIDTYEFTRDGFRDEIGDCSPGALRVGVLGDSITYGVKTDYEETFIKRLHRAMESQCGEICLLNVATPGYSVLQERISYERKLAPHHPDLVFIGLYSNDIAHFTVMGSMAYDVRMKEHDGLPVFSLLPVPDSVNAFLVSGSVLYQFLTLRGLKIIDEATGKHLSQRDFALAELEHLKTRCEQEGTQLVVALFPDLEAPFSSSEPASSSFFFDAVRNWSMEEGLPLIDIRPLLVGEDHTRIRLDECCHYNRAGHRVVARVLLQQFEQLGIIDRLQCRLEE